jgi:hypothetical protein
VPATKGVGTCGDATLALGNLSGRLKLKNLIPPTESVSVSLNSFFFRQKIGARSFFFEFWVTLVRSYHVGKIED